MPYSRRETISRSVPPMDNITREVQSLIISSMAYSSWKTYKTAVDALHTFRLLFNLENIWSVSIDTIAHFIGYLSLKGFAASTVTTYISALSHVHKMGNLIDNTKSVIVSKMLKGLRRKNPKTRDIRVPISLSLLKRLIVSLQKVCNSRYDTFLFSAALSIAFFGMLRVSEVTIKRRSDEVGHTLNFKNVSFQKVEAQTVLRVLQRPIKNINLLLWPFINSKIRTFVQFSYCNLT